MEVRGYPNYLIYPDGRVWSKKTKLFLKASDNSSGGYLQVGLSKDGNQKSHKIHRLVAEHYIPNPDNKPCVDHIYRDKTDNRVENLRWATISENGQNRGVQKNNKVGIKNICYDKINDTYKYEKKINNKIHKKTFKTLKEALCYKYIFTLKMRAGLV
jgi:hypothetical protein